MASPGANGTSNSAEWAQLDAIWKSALPSTQKLVALAYVDHDRRGRRTELYPSLEYVVWMTGKTASTVRLAVRALETLGVLERSGHVVSKVLVDGMPRGRVNKYRFHADRLPQRQPWRNGRSLPAADDNRQPLNFGPTAAESEPQQPPIVGGDRTGERELNGVPPIGFVNARRSISTRLCANAAGSRVLPFQLQVAARFD